MALDDRDEGLRGALAVALVVFLTCEKRRRAKTLAEWALILDVLEDTETAERKESEDGDDPRVKRTRQVHPRSYFFQASWSIMLRKPELKQRDSRGTENFADISVPYEFFLELIMCVVCFLPIQDIKFVGRTSRGHTGGRSHRISHPPSFCGACLNFSREKDSAISFPRRP